jgi:valyl-tRNA synthetase
MESRYDHNLLESKIYQLWEKQQAFSPDRKPSTSVKKTGKQFSIIMPPPNANDPLHIGHASFVALEDALVRFHRMQGDDTVWIPGTDHAGIETQYVFEKRLQKEGKSRFDFDRNTLFEKIWQYVADNSGVAIDQIKKIGASADWSRYKFTLDPEIVDLVKDLFRTLHKNGLIYRDLQLVNYCTKCGTSYSELEVNHTDQTTPLYYVKYYFVDDPENYLTVATVRPEPIFVDTHIAVNPTDKKNKHLVGKSVKNPLTGKSMLIIASDFVDPEFGTGVVKMTPAHDAEDFAVAKKLKLPIIEAIDKSGKITAAGGKYAGLSVLEARKQVVADLTDSGQIEKIDHSYQNRIGTCYRCGRAIEPMPLPQFFIKVKDKKQNLVKEVLKNLDNKSTIVHGAGQEKILRHWLKNLKDWNISRQIVWGIKIPVWYQVDGFENQIQVTFLDKSKKIQKGLLSELLPHYSLEEIITNLQQTTAFAEVVYKVGDHMPDKGNWIPETDTFDTWFSSSQWPVVTLKTTGAGDFERFYPTSVMETGYDILPFWVMRMMLLCTYLTGKTPFEEIYLHGLVRDQKGQKMSKSKGNVINPVQIIEKYSADALRMALVIRSTPGQDKNVGEADFKAMRNLTNKIWNAGRFVLMGRIDNPDNNSQAGDAAFYVELSKIQTEITNQMLNRKLGLAAETTYNQFWHWFCDQCIEQNKSGQISGKALLEGLISFLKLLHPFVPFVTEAVWQSLLENKLVKEELLITSAWPQPIKLAS